MVDFDVLTEREQEILGLLADGLSNREIAARLHLSYKTVKWYNTQIYSKLGVHNRDAALESAQVRRLLATTALRHNLPQQTTAFIGRQQELTDLTRLLDDPAARLITVLAPGGMGKTRLALAAAEQQLHHFADGVFFVPLGPLASSGDIETVIAEQLGYSFFGRDAPDKQLLEFLQRRNLLLLLDNFEHLLDAATLVTDILQAASAVKILVTSREKINLSQETVFTLTGLQFPDADTVEDAHSFDAVQLFVQRAQLARPTFDPQAESLDALAQICHLTAGMPLGIELAAGWVDMLSLKQIAEEIQQGLDILKTGLRDVPERHRSIRATFERTWDRLADDEQAIFTKLSVFRGGFTADAAEAVAGANLHQLRKLVDKALVQVAAENRYTMHELLRQYAAEKLDQVAGTRNIAEQHLDYYISLAEEAERHQFGGEQATWFNRLEADIENIRSALAWSLETENAAKGLHLGGLMATFWSMRNYTAEGYNWLARLLTTPTDGLLKLRAGALFQVARMAAALGHAQAALAHGEEALAVARSIEDPSLIAYSLLNLGGITSRQQDIAQAEILLDESLMIFRELDDPHGVNNALRMQSANAIRQGKISYARRLLSDVISHSSDSGHTIGLADANELLGIIAWTWDKNAELARSHLVESLGQYGETGFSLPIARIRVSLALVEHAAGNHTQIQPLFEAAYLLLKELEHTELPLLDYILFGQGIIAGKQGDHQQAAVLFAAAEKGVKNDSFWLGNAFVDSYDQDIAGLRDQMGDIAFAKAWASGKAMSREQAINFALDQKPSNQPLDR